MDFQNSNSNMLEIMCKIWGNANFNCEHTKCVHLTYEMCSLYSISFGSIYLALKNHGRLLLHGGCHLEYAGSSEIIVILVPIQVQLSNSKRQNNCFTITLWRKCSLNISRYNDSNSC